MATIEDFIHNILTNTAGIAAIAGTRVYRIKMPDNPTLPAITYHTITGEHIESRDGFSNLSNPIIGIDCWARTAKAAQDLAYLLRDTLIGYSGTYSDRTIGNVLEWSQEDLYDADTDIFHVACSVRAWYS
jgi:hypothetical protein